MPGNLLKHDHLPDCTSITDDELKETAMSRWESTTISYSFSRIPFYLQFPFINITQMKPRRIDKELDIVEATIKKSLDRWERISHHTIQFVKQPNSYFISSRIYFMFIEQSILDEMNALGSTFPVLNAEGYFKQAFIFLTNDINQWLKNHENALLDLTIAHELSHAIGAEHFHDFPRIKNKLKKIPNGTFCSVSAYHDYVKSPISECISHRITAPGNLDGRFVSLVYHKDFLPPKYGNQTSIRSLVIAAESVFLAGEAWIYIASILAINLIAKEIRYSHIDFLTHLKTRDDKPIFSKRAATLINDLSTALMLYVVHTPSPFIQLYLITITVEFFANNKIKPSPYLINGLLTSFFSDDGIRVMDLAISALGTYSIPSTNSFGRFFAESINGNSKKDKDSINRKRHDSPCVRLMRWFGFGTAKEKIDDGIDIEMNVGPCLKNRTMVV